MEEEIYLSHVAKHYKLQMRKTCSLKTGVVACISTTWEVDVGELGVRDNELEASLGYMRPYLTKPKPKPNNNKRNLAF